MKKTLSPTEQKLFITYLTRLSVTARQEAFDFLGYLQAKSETEEGDTHELLKDKKMMAGIKRGLAQIKQGKVSKVEF